MWLVVVRNATNIVVKCLLKVGSFVLDQMWIFFKVMSSWEKSQFRNS